MAKQLRRLAACLNCGRGIEGENFCPACGQENTDEIVSTSHLLRDVIDEFLKFDSKLFATLKLLLLKPGRLTQAYLEGRRARYITPLRLYFTISALFFLVYSWSGWDQVIHQIVTQQQKPMNSITSVDQLVSSIQVKGGEPVRSDDPESRKMQAVSRKIQDFQQRIGAMQGYLTTNLSLIKFFFIPMTALVMQLLYLRSKRLYVEHLVFTAHVNTFSYLISIPGMCLHNFVLYNILTSVATPLYTFLALRVVYPQSFWKMLIKCILIIILPMILFIFLFILISVGLLLVSFMSRG